MQNKEINIKFTECELDDIWVLADQMLEEGSYFGRRDYYINRLKSIKNKISKARNYIS